MPNANSQLGHRQRLRQRFIVNGLDGFLDYEIVELLLTLGTPRRDCKQQAKTAIAKFGNLQKVLDADIEELRQIDGIGPNSAVGIVLFKKLLTKYYQQKIEPKKSINSAQEIFEYLKEKIGKQKKEHFVLLFFNTRNELIHTDISIGTVNASLVHPREVFNPAILHNASHVIVAHNHPSGDPSPSNDDINTTKRLVAAGKIIGITIVDHIIVSRNSYSSLKELNHLAP